MALASLCPSKLNQLGKNSFSPELENSLLSSGYIFAARVPNTLVSGLVVCKRPIALAVTDGELDRRRPSRHRLAAPSAA